MKLRQSKRTITVVLLALLLVGSTSVSAVGTVQDEVAEQPTIRAAHMSPGAPSVDVLVDDTLVAENVSFSEVSDYQAVESGEHRFVVRTTDGGEEVFNGSATVPPNGTFTFLVTGRITSNETVDLEPRLLVDNYTVPSENNASVRLVHASPDVEAVDVTLRDGETVLFDNVTFRDDSDYATGQAGNYTLEIREEDEDDDGDVIETFNVSLESGTVTTVFVSGLEDTDDAPVDIPFGFVSVTDAGDEGTEQAESTD